MTCLADIEGHIASMQELHNVVGAMRSLAGMRMQEAQRALPGIRRYAGSIAGAIGSALLLMPQGAMERPGKKGPKALVLCAGEHGFVGGFNERLLEAAEAALEASDALFVLGGRGALFAAERGRQVAWTSPMATRPASVPRSVSELAAALYSRIMRGEISRVEVMFDRYRQGSPSVIEHALLLPLDIDLLANKPRQAPLHNLEAGPLFEKLAAEYVFARLTEAAVKSIASENAARFAVMDSAQGNVSKKLDQLQQQAHQARQTEITTELLDLITGAEALAGGRPGSS